MVWRVAHRNLSAVVHLYFIAQEEVRTVCGWVERVKEKGKESGWYLAMRMMCQMMMIGSLTRQFACDKCVDVGVSGHLLWENQFKLQIRRYFLLTLLI